MIQQNIDMVIRHKIPEAAEKTKTALLLTADIDNSINDCYIQNFCSNEYC